MAPSEKLSSYLPPLQTPRLTLRLMTASEADYGRILHHLNTPSAYASVGNMGLTDRASFDEKHKNLYLRRELLTKLSGDVEVDVLGVWLLYLRADPDLTQSAPFEISSSDSTVATETKGEKGGESVGLFSLLHRSASIPPDIGFVLDEQFHRRGYASEAARGLLAFLQRQLGIRAVMGYTKPGNVASAATMRKAGMGPIDDATVIDRDGTVIEVVAFVACQTEEIRESLKGVIIKRGGE